MSARDPIVALGRELGQFGAAWNKANVDQLTANKAGNRTLYDQLGEKQRALGQRMTMLEHAITALRASSVQGALVQLAVASSLVNMLAMEADDSNAEKLHGEVEHLLYSIAGVLERLSGTTLEALGQERLMPRYASPLERRKAAA